MKKYLYQIAFVVFAVLSLVCYISGGAKSLGQHLSVDRKADDMKIDNINKNEDVASDRNQDERLILVTLIPNSADSMYYKNKWDSIRKIIDSECPDNIYTFKSMQNTIIYNRWASTDNKQLDEKLDNPDSRLNIYLSNPCYLGDDMIESDCVRLLYKLFKYVKDKNQSENKACRLLGLDVHQRTWHSKELYEIEPYSNTRLPEIFEDIMFGDVVKTWGDFKEYLVEDSVRLKKLLGEDELFLWRYTAKEIANEHDLREYCYEPEKLDSVMCGYYHDLKKRFKGSNMVIAQPGLIRLLEKEGE